MIILKLVALAVGIWRATGPPPREILGWIEFDGRFTESEFRRFRREWEKGWDHPSRAKLIPL